MRAPQVEFPDYPSDLGRQDPFVMEEFFRSRNVAIQNSLDILARRSADPKYILVNGKPLDEHVDDNVVPRGTIRMFHISWADARNMRGWAICDGTRGTPKFHGTPLRFPRAGTWGADAGATGGCGTHSHAVAGTHSHAAGSYEADAANAHDHAENTAMESAHTHTITGETTDSGGIHSHGATSGGCESADGVEVTVCGGSGCTVLCVGHTHGTGSGGGHTHGYSGTTDAGAQHRHGIVEEAAHTHTISGTSGTASSGTTDTADGLPPYLDLIFMMKL